MIINILAAAGGEAAPQNKFGFVEALNQGGIIAYSIFTILVIMSVGSFYILITKWLEQQKILNQYKTIRTSFWRAPNLKEGAAKLDKNSAWRQIVDDGLAAEDQHGKMTDSLEAHDWLHGSLARSESAVNSKLAGGLPFLATVGATAPFVGLLGTVIGIYRALIAIGLAGSASIDKVAGPVGEALIMTAIGLLVAVPAVLAYNWLQARNKRIAELLSGFSTDILANINSKGAVKPALQAAPAAKAAPKAPAAKPATTTAGVPPKK
ncbi:MotA/TolQ/ExbB proton channel family protein [Altererythrobacter sp. FM1]|uniref:Biopolymer transport protein ExbB n=1 Tax=Tsuneonella flava TaxID=2055955 RepID=A0ABX7KBQ9_9SPHN|nr:MotA/TolQ/ExbB proton channel family protein [Tsuneonella flava]QSB45298.1 MotA/TolQ/ExbB proton channel family protein [Tsuneonella flava]ROT96992.1 MotA/TolQ/ExbB proton channel family protein [Altererythrobacter sp. FM1]